MEKNKTKIYDYDVSFLRSENARGFVEAETEAEAREKITAEAKKQGLIHFTIRSISVLDTSVSDFEEAFDAGEEIPAGKTPPKVLN